MEVSTDMNCSQINFTGTNKMCFDFSEKDLNIVTWLRTGLSIFAAICIAVNIIVILCLRDYKSLLARLFLYLCLAAIFNATMTAIQPIPIRHMCHHVVVKNTDACTGLAAVIESSVWAILVLMTWIGVHLFLMGGLLKDVDCDENTRRRRKYECCIISTTLAFPLVCLIPLIHANKKRIYGLSGAWCWIRATDDDCHQLTAGIIEEFMLWYVPVMVFVIFFIVITVVVLIALCVRVCSAKNPPSLRFKYCIAVKEMCPLLIYPVIFSLIYSLGFINRIYYAATHKTTRGLWISHAVVDPMLPLSIPIAFSLHRIWLKKNRHRSHFTQETHYSVSNEFSNEECTKLKYGNEQNDYGSTRETVLPQI